MAVIMKSSVLATIKAVIVAALSSQTPVDMTNNYYDQCMHILCSSLLAIRAVIRDIFLWLRLK